MILLILIFLTTLIVFTLRSDFDNVVIKKTHVKFFNVIALIAIIMLVTPLSFVGEFFDKVLFLYLYIFCMIKIITIRKKTSSFIKSIFIFLFVVEILFGIYLFISIFVGDRILSRIQTNYITKDGDYRFVHRKVDSDFMYEGYHEITIQKRIKYFPILELRKGKVKLETYLESYGTPSRELKVNEKQNTLIIIHRNNYIYKDGIFNDTSFIDTIKFKY